MRNATKNRSPCSKVPACKRNGSIIPANYRISFWWKNADPQLKIANKDSTYFEISTNGGTSWTILDVLSPSIGMSAYINSIKDLSSYVGNNVYFRWRYNLSVASGYKNVYIDDIKVEPIPVSYTHLTLPTNREV